MSFFPKSGFEVLHPSDGQLVIAAHPTYWIVFLAALAVLAVTRLRETTIADFIAYSVIGEVVAGKNRVLAAKEITDRVEGKSPSL